MAVLFGARAKLDENLPSTFADQLRGAGLEVCTVPEEGLVGAEDDLVAAAAVSEGRVLVTLDLDFASIVRWPPGLHPGIVVLRPKSNEPAALTPLLEATVAALGDPENRGALIVVGPRGTRVRRAGA